MILLSSARVLLCADTKPACGAPEEWDREVSAKLESVWAIQRSLTGVRPPRSRVVDRTTVPRLIAIGRFREAAQYVEPDDRAVPKHRVGIETVANLAAELVPGRPQPDDAPAEILAARVN